VDAPKEIAKAFEGGTGSGFLFVGNRACLDFVNTRVVEGGRPVDLLGGFPDLARWLVEAGLLDAEGARRALEGWRGTPESDRAFREALSFRAALRETCERIVRGERVEQAIVDRINRLLVLRAGYDQLVRTVDGFERRFRQEVNEGMGLLTPVADSAADLLSRDDLSLVKKCENPECVLFFYDSTKNHARRWCSMAACGNRSKVAAHNRRKKEGRVP
jgi:predicted RNA-binding Zn ribbon-like protein